MKQHLPISAKTFIRISKYFTETAKIIAISDDILDNLDNF